MRTIMTFDCWKWVYINSRPDLACFLNVNGRKTGLLLVVPGRHCREKHWLPLHKCFFLLTWIRGSCIYCHVLSCAHVCMCIRLCQEDGKKHSCTNMFVSCVAPKMKIETRTAFWFIIENDLMQNLCLNITHLQIHHPVAAAAAEAAGFFFFLFLIIITVCLAPKVDQGLHAKKSLVASRITTLKLNRCRSIKVQLVFSRSSRCRTNLGRSWSRETVSR